MEKAHSSSDVINCRGSDNDQDLESPGTAIVGQISNSKFLTPKAESSDYGIQNQIQQLANKQHTLSTVTESLIQNINVVKLKSGPKRKVLREKLKKQLQVQQELLQVQQEIFMKANQAQNDILKLIADLDDDDEMETVEEEEQYVEDPNVVVEDASLLNPIDIVDIKEFVSENEPPHDENIYVIMGTDDGDEEYELIEVDEEEPDKPEVCLEVYANDGDNMGYRIVEQESTKPVAKKSRRKENPAASTRKQQSNQSMTRVIVGDEELLAMSADEVAEYVQQVVQSVEVDEEGRFACPLCEEKFTNRYSVGPHLQRIHCKQKSKECPYCYRAFTCTGDLTR